MNEEGAHILVGIVSSKDTCREQDYAVFTNVSTLLPWIESSIKTNGGMTSCSYNIYAPPILGMLASGIYLLYLKSVKIIHFVQENHWSLPLPCLVFFCLAVNRQKDNSIPLRPLALRTVRFLLCQRPVTVVESSSPPRSHHSSQFVEGGGRENQTLQIA